MFYKISSSVGSGKTQAVLEHIRDNLGIGYLYVCPTRQLCEQVYQRLLVQLAAYPDYANNGPVHHIVGEGNNNEPVFPRALQACRNYDARLPPIIIVTTATFEYLLRELLDYEKGRFTVFIDEGLPEIKQERFSPGDKAVFLDRLQSDGAKFVSPAAGQQEVLEWVAYTPGRLEGQSLDHLNVAQFREVAKMVVSPNYDVYMNETDRSLEFLGLLSPEPLRAFRSVCLIVAIFERTLLPILWRQRHGIEFEDYPIGVELYDAHEAKGQLMSIWHVLHAGDLPSKRNLRRNFETGEADEGDPRNQVIYHAGRQIDQHFSETVDGVYCWTANSDFTNPDNVLSGIHMPPKSAGLDQFRRFNAVASLLCINPQPWVKRQLTEVLELEEDRLYELWRFSHTYQAIGRCSLRVRETDQPIQVIVPSRACAETLRGLFSGSTVVGQVTDLPRLSQPTVAERIEEELGISYTRADNTAYSKYCKVRRKRGEELLEKPRWFREIRLPRLEGGG